MGKTKELSKDTRDKIGRMGELAKSQGVQILMFLTRIRALSRPPRGRNAKTPPWEMQPPTPDQGPPTVAAGGALSGEASWAVRNRHSVELLQYTCAEIGVPITPPRFSQDLEFRECNPRLPGQNERHSRAKGAHHRMWESPKWMCVQDDIDVHRRVPHSRPVQMSNEQNWYIGACQRAEAENALHLTNQNGVFVVRDHSKSTEEEPFVLAVLQDNRVYNIKIRYIKSNSKFALGTGLRMNDMFDSVNDIIKFHMIFPINLINGKDLSAHQRRCMLTRPLTREEMTQLLG